MTSENESVDAFAETLELLACVIPDLGGIGVDANVNISGASAESPLEALFILRLFWRKAFSVASFDVTLVSASPSLIRRLALPSALAASGFTSVDAEGVSEVVAWRPLSTRSNRALVSNVIGTISTAFNGDFASASTAAFFSWLNNTRSVFDPLFCTVIGLSALATGDWAELAVLGLGIESGWRGGWPGVDLLGFGLENLLLGTATSHVGVGGWMFLPAGLPRRIKGGETFRWADSFFAAISSALSSLSGLMLDGSKSNTRSVLLVDSSVGVVGSSASAGVASRKMFSGFFDCSVGLDSFDASAMDTASRESGDGFDPHNPILSQLKVANQPLQQYNYK
jgi:hypothetical protein